jgi:hypothetical protein
MEPTKENIARLAYQFYLEDGKVPGNASEHWTRAEEFLRHPENHSDTNILTPPSEPELTRALEEKARQLDENLPSDPHSGAAAVHQEMEIALDPRGQGREGKVLKEFLRGVSGVERVEIKDHFGRLQIRFDARRTNPAAIHEAILTRGRKPAAAAAE